MSTLDQSSFLDPKTVSSRDLVVRYGLIWGGVNVLLSLVGSLLYPNPLEEKPGMAWQMFSGILTYGLPFLLISRAILEDRKQLGGFIGFGRCVGLAVKTALLAGVIAALFAVLYMTVINPGLMDDMREYMMQEYEKSNMDEKQIEMSMNIFSMFQNPVVVFLTVIAAYAAGGAIVGLILGAILNKPNFRA